MGMDYYAHSPDTGRLLARGYRDGLADVTHCHGAGGMGYLSQELR